MKGRNIELSVIIPTHNRPSQLRRCLAALAQQDYPREQYEVIIVDDGGQVPLDPVISEFNNQLYITVLHVENSGPAAARNLGAQQANGQYLVFTDDDTFAEYNWLSILAIHFNTEPDSSAGGRVINSFPDKIFSAASHLIIEFVYAHYNRNPQNAHFFTTNNFAVPANRFHELFGFASRELPFASEDRDLCARLLESGHRMIYRPDAVVNHACELNFFSFWRQHFRYGQGAFHFHRRHRKNISGIGRFQSFSFYINMIFYPFKAYSAVKAVLLVFFIFLSQLASSAGFIFAGLKHIVREMNFYET